MARILSGIGRAFLLFAVVLSAVCGVRGTLEEVEKDELVVTGVCEARLTSTRSLSRNRQDWVSTRPAISLRSLRETRRATGQPVLVEGHRLPNGLLAPLRT
jgi:hypothetical protein